MTTIKNYLNSLEKKYGKKILLKSDIKEDCIYIVKDYWVNHYKELIWIENYFNTFSNKFDYLQETKPEEYLNKYIEWDIESWGSRREKIYDSTLGFCTPDPFEHVENFKRCLKNGTLYFETLEYLEDFQRLQKNLNNTFKKMFSITKNNNSLPVYLCFYIYPTREEQEENNEDINLFLVKTDFYFNINCIKETESSDIDKFFKALWREMYYRLYINVRSFFLDEYKSNLIENNFEFLGLRRFLTSTVYSQEIIYNCKKCSNINIHPNENTFKGLCLNCLREEFNLETINEKDLLYNIDKLNQYEKKIMSALFDIRYFNKNSDIYFITSREEIASKSVTNLNYIHNNLIKLQSLGLINFKNEKNEYNIRINRNMTPYMLVNNILEQLTFEEKLPKNTTHIKTIFQSIYEIKLYNKLLESFPKNFISIKPRIADVIVKLDTLTTEEKDYYFKAHLDFVVCDKLNMLPLFIVECDGHSHDINLNTKTKDILKDSICIKADIPLIRVDIRDIDNNIIISKIFSKVKKLS